MQPDPDQWKILEETFHAALQLPEHERQRYLDEVCANDPELRRQVESLLKESSQMHEFMERPAPYSLVSLENESLEGRALNHYQIGPMIDSGGMADVYRARDTRLQRDVAIKIVRDVRFMDKERFDRMFREARVLATLNHPNIASIHGIEESEGICGLVLELIEGETLSKRIAREPLSISEVLAIAKQIASGLQAAHAKGIIHRDLKPANVKLTTDRSVKIIDFGIAKLLHSPEKDATATGFSTEGALIGTVPYMSPEQARGKSIDTRTDVWAFGCVLYEMLAGKRAFQGETATDIIIKIATEEPDWNSIPRFPEGVSKELQRVVRKCMEKDPDRRYQSVLEISADLDGIETQTRKPPEPPPPIEPVPPGPEPPAPRPFVPAIPFGLALFLLSQIGYLALYTAALYHIDAIARILALDFEIPARGGLIGTIVLAMCGIAVRMYLITAVGWRHPAAERKFTLLFPVLLLLDGIWAASPLLVWHHIGFGLALAGVAMLAYVPFAQRTLIRSIYARRPDFGGGLETGR